MCILRGSNPPDPRNTVNGTGYCTPHLEGAGPVTREALALIDAGKVVLLPAADLSTLQVRPRPLDGPGGE
jgi:hypothetical protein